MAFHRKVVNTNSSVASHCSDNQTLFLRISKPCIIYYLTHSRLSNTFNHSSPLHPSSIGSSYSGRLSVPQTPQVCLSASKPWLLFFSLLFHKEGSFSLLFQVCSQVTFAERPFLTTVAK